eukprot:1160490-Pelagomonas_calceolata.AAC.2
MSAKNVTGEGLLQQGLGRVMHRVRRLIFSTDYRVRNAAYYESQQAYKWSGTSAGNSASSAFDQARSIIV